MHLGVALGRTTDQDGRPQLRLQFPDHAVHGDAGCSHDIHPIESAEPVQLRLGGGNIHDDHGIPPCFIVGKRQDPAHGGLESTWPDVDCHGITSGHAQACRQLAIHKNRFRAEQGIQREFLVTGDLPHTRLPTEHLQQVQSPYHAGPGVSVSRFECDGL